MSKTTRIHVNQHIIKANRKTPSKRKPPLTIKTYDGNIKADRVFLKGKDGEIIARIIYQPDSPLSCGAEVWIETLDTNVEVLA